MVAAEEEEAEKIWHSKEGKNVGAVEVEVVCVFSCAFQLPLHPAKTHTLLSYYT